MQLCPGTRKLRPYTPALLSTANDKSLDLCHQFYPKDGKEGLISQAIILAGGAPMNVAKDIHNMVSQAVVVEVGLRGKRPGESPRDTSIAREQAT